MSNMRITINFAPFHAAFNEKYVRMFLRDVGEKTKQIMVQQAAAPKTGKQYPYGQASAPGEFPANKTGALSKSYRVEIHGHEMDIGTNVSKYPTFLRTGTRKMEPRKFLRQALEDAMEMEHFKGPFVEFRK